MPTENRSSNTQPTECQFHNNCGGWCETQREQEHNLCVDCLEAHDEDMRAKPEPAANEGDAVQDELKMLDFALSFALCNMDHAGTRRDVKKAQESLEKLRKLIAVQHQGELVAEVVDMKYNLVRFYRATGDTSKPYLLPGTKLYSSAVIAGNDHEPYGWVQTRGPAINQFTQEWDIVQEWEEQGFQYKAMHDHPAPVDAGEVERLRKRILDYEEIAESHADACAEALTRLAERDALLTDISKRHWSGVDFDLPADLVARIKSLSASAEPSAPASFQARVQPWLMACFGEMIAGDRQERNHRFLEEALELVQALGATAGEAHQLVDYVFGRQVGEPAQEVGGVMVTMAALCLANGMDMHQLAEAELARIWTKVEAIRAKQANKPQFGPLPGVYPERGPSAPAAQYPNRLCHIDYRTHPYLCGCLRGDEEAQKIYDDRMRSAKS
ncbi:hypothetical protein [Pseudomonas putida]|uniref:hypothetical protein n=1 Tax=Pseudomonas putida TaxID=303 RepID=UPI000ACCDB63|nr:hypothetical protein [Pseudomonas putida]